MMSEGEWVISMPKKNPLGKITLEEGERNVERTRDKRGGNCVTFQNNVTVASRVHPIIMGLEEIGSLRSRNGLFFLDIRITCFGRKLSSMMRLTTCGLWLSSWPSTELPPSVQAWSLRPSVFVLSTSLSRTSRTIMR